MHSGAAKVQDNLSLFVGDRMCDSLLAMASRFHISRPRSPRAIGRAFGLCLPTLLIKGSVVEKLPSYGDLKMQRVQ